MVRLGGTMNAPATRIIAPHLNLTTFATDDTVARGTHFSVVVDGTPEKNVHIYAPGVTGYMPLALMIDAQSGLVVLGNQFPEPEDYFFKPLNEHVPVYQKPFRVVQDLMVDPSHDAEAALRDVARLVITGTLTYQARDDKVCFLPQSAQLNWTVNLKSLDRERAKPR